jgi:hypothetical protein
VNEHEFEPVRGLPEPLPPGERILWQGSPSPGGLARRAYHATPIAAYFALLLAWAAVHALQSGQPFAQAAGPIATLALLAVVAVGLLVYIARLAARTALYTITTRRVVMRIGIVLTVSFNLPFTTIAAAALRSYGDGSGDISLALTPDNKIAWVHLWPHTRPWRLKRPEPTLRSIPNAAAVADILARAVAAAQVPAVAATARPAPAREAAADTRPLAAA